MPRGGVPHGVAVEKSKTASLRLDQHDSRHPGRGRLRTRDLTPTLPPIPQSQPLRGTQPVPLFGLRVSLYRGAGAHRPEQFRFS